MGPEETKSVLTKLVSDGHIALLDGWRSLELLKADIVDTTPLPGGEVTKSSGSLAARAQRLPRRPALQPRTAAVSAAQTDTVSNSLEKVIQVLEQRVNALRGLEGGNEQELKAFEVCVATLKRENDVGTELSSSVRKALTGSVLASVKRLVALGGK